MGRGRWTRLSELSSRLTAKLCQMTTYATTKQIETSMNSRNLFKNDARSQQRNMITSSRCAAVTHFIQRLRVAQCDIPPANATSLETATHGHACQKDGFLDFENAPFQNKFQLPASSFQVVVLQRTFFLCRPHIRPTHRTENTQHSFLLLTPLFCFVQCRFTITVVEPWLLCRDVRTPNSRAVSRRRSRSSFDGC